MHRTTKFRLATGATIGTLAIGGAAAWAVLGTDSLTEGDPAEPEQSITDDTTDDEPSPAPSAEDPNTGQGEAEEPQEDLREALALEAAEVMTTWDPAADHSQTAAELRAADLVDDSISEVLAEPENPTYSPEWREAAEREAVSVPDAQLREVTENRYYDVEVTWAWEAEGENPIREGPRYFTFVIDDDAAGEPIITHYEWHDGR